MISASPANCLRTSLGQPQSADLPLLDEAGHRADRLLDRHGIIDAMLVVEVNRIDTKSLQARFASLIDVFGAAIDSDASIRSSSLAELGRDYRFVSSPPQRTTEQFLVMTPPIHIRRVEHVDAAIKAPVNCRNRLGLVGGSVDPRHRHQSEPKRQHFQQGSVQNLQRGIRDTHGLSLGLNRKCRASLSSGPRSFNVSLSNLKFGIAEWTVGLQLPAYHPRQA